MREGFPDETPEVQRYCSRLPFSYSVIVPKPAPPKWNEAICMPGPV
jgi:hypothetical protein